MSSNVRDNEDMSFGVVAAEAAELFFGDSYEIRKSFETVRKNVLRPTGGTVGSATRLTRTQSAQKPPQPPKPARPPQPQQPVRPPVVKSATPATALPSTRHRPRKMRIRPVQFDTQPAPAIAKSDEFEVMCEISKVDSDKRQVFGWASISKKDGETIKDLQGDSLDTDELEKAAYEYIIKSRKGGYEHKRNDDGTPTHVADLIESFVVTPEKKEALNLPEETPEGWWIGMKVNDDKVWELAKSGELAGFSIHGSGRRVYGDGEAARR